MTTFNLITGDYTPMEAKEILLKMVDTKINFHKVKSFSDYVRYGKPNLESDLKVKELQESREQILALVQEAVGSNSRIEIESAMNVSFEAKVQPKEHIQNEEVTAGN
ncbi:hypothetical protein GCM10027443_25490 [Pontibacter brevis]